MINLGVICEGFIFFIFLALIYALFGTLKQATNNFHRGYHPIDLKNIKFKPISLKNFNLKHLNQILTTPISPTRAEPLNLIGMIFLLVFELIMIVIKVGFWFNGTSGDLPGLIMALIPAILILIFVLDNLIRSLFGVKKVRRFGLASEEEKISKKTGLIIEFKRKLWHIISLLVMVGALIAGYYYFHSKYMSTNDAAYFQVVQTYWGDTSGIHYLKSAFIRKSLSMGHVLLILFMYGATLLLLFLDATRLSRNIQSFLHRGAQSNMRYKEIDTFASYTHFTVSYLCAAMILPPILFLATFTLGTFADPMASLIGMKWGKHHLPWGKKTWEGNIAGTLTAFISCLPLVGIVYSLMGALVFCLLDIFTPKPIQMSDNLLMPIILTIVFILLSLIGVPAHNILGL
ncbi:MAG: hypothetical protein ACTSWL_01485 [Promethearchaeota archaeon]